MTRTLTALAAVAFAAGFLLVGCKAETPPNTPPASPNPPATTPEASADEHADHDHADHDHADHDHDHADHGHAEQVTADDVKKQVGEAAQTTAAFASQEKDKWVASAEERLSAWKNKFDAWADTADEKSAKLREDAKVKYDEAVEKLGEVKEASGGAWVDVKDGFTKACNELEAAAKDAAGNFGGEGGGEAAAGDLEK